jgi:hypothetical protein
MFTLSVEVDPNLILGVLGVCSGRSLIPNSNGWLNVFCPMAATDTIVKHALLAFASGYLLRMQYTEEQRQRANKYYMDAVTSINLSLRNAKSITFGQEDVLVTALRIVWSDMVNMISNNFSQALTLVR